VCGELSSKEERNNSLFQHGFRASIYLSNSRLFHLSSLLKLQLSHIHIYIFYLPLFTSTTPSIVPLSLSCDSLSLCLTIT
jgi:hypothetical protein